ncbi:MAG: PilZ domain-containing protein, partial [Gammaproteobacteria bacterium]|nr:PilZ domain-containing protein [Gammaproteobacteria bacterium]
MNRRRHARQPISISALVHPEQGRSWLCSIKDFCHDGMLLTGAGGSRSLTATGAQANPGDPIALHFSVATPNGQQHFRTQATIARMLSSGNGIGVRFDDGLAEEAFECLIEFAVASGMLPRSAAVGGETYEGETVVSGEEQTATSSSADGVGEVEIPDELFRDRRINEKDAAEVRDRMRRVVKRAMDRLSKQFFKVADTELILRARDAGTNAVQMMYFEGLDLLEKHRDSISSTFVGDVVRQVDNVSELDDILE